MRKLIGKRGPISTSKYSYEANPTGYVLYWQLTQPGVACEVIAPTLVPVKSGDRVKTDRRNARRQIVTVLARELLGFMWAIALYTEAQLQ